MKPEPTGARPVAPTSAPEAADRDAHPVTPDAVMAALRAIRYARPLRPSPLIEADFVTLHLRREGLADTPQGREWALARQLEATVRDHYARARGAALDPTTCAEREDARLLDDLRSANAERLTWGLLYVRFLSPLQPPVGRIAAVLGMTERAVQKRLVRGCEVLAARLRELEVAARRQVEAGSGLAPHDRIVGHDGAPRRSEADVLGAILAMLRSGEGVVRIHTQQLDVLARYPASDARSYRLGRIAQWSLPRYRLDERYVTMSLLVDRGEEARSGRWQPREERFDGLSAVLAAMADPALVVLGPPGSGKSTQLRRLELDLALDALAAAPGAAPAPLTFLVSLNQYRAERHGDHPPSPGAWLAHHWAARYPTMPPFDELLAAGGMVLLLDGLNEMPHRDLDDYRERVRAWKQFLHDRVAAVPGNRMVVACRSLDYSTSLSTPRLRVPHVQLEPLTDDQVRAFLARYSPGNDAVLWSAMAAHRALDALRWPFVLRMWVELATETGQLDGGLAAVFTGFVRRALARELERDNPLFAPEALLTARDRQRLTGTPRWRSPWELPEGGALFPALARLAHAMQTSAAPASMSQVRIDLEAARAVVDGGHGADVLGAGAALGVLEEDRASSEVLFGHQLLQEYFAARAMAARPEPARVAAPWRAADVRPALHELLDTLPAGEPLPGLPATGWEETTVLAASMAASPSAFLRSVMAHNLALAGRAATLPAVRARLDEDMVDALRRALVARSRDPRADLRDRIACGYAVGDLGDPRFERRTGPHGAYLAPPMVGIPGGDYPIGADEPIEWQSDTFVAHVPRHRVEIAPFRIGQVLVTNAEYRCFVDAGGYESDAWWDTAVGRDWRRGKGTAAHAHGVVRYWLARYRDEPGLLEASRAGWVADDAIYDRWKTRLAMTPRQLEAHLHEMYPEQRFTEPRYWPAESLSRPAQPVVGICVYEARAYCAWLAAQTGDAFRLPTEVEWEAAARGLPARAYAYGDAFDPLRANTLETRVLRPTPVGVFVTGDTPEGVADLTGNVSEWTSSLFGTDGDGPEFGYPYRPDDGREDAAAAPSVYRVVRGCAYKADRGRALAAFRSNTRAMLRDPAIGFRVVASGASPGRG